MPESLVGRSQRRKRSAAWVYYALITLGAVVAGFSAPALFLFALFTGLYSSYLYRGGRFVVWFW